jgi:hypothetical protein
MLRFLEEYAKHSVLNLGQVLQGLRYFFSHPDIDATRRRGTLGHALASARLRAKRIANDFFFTLLPPHWHHTREELAGMASIPLSRWFQCGYSPWRFTESGDLKEDLGDADRRWDPRCGDSAA